MTVFSLTGKTALIKQFNAGDIALFPGSAQFFVACNMEEQERLRNEAM